MGAQQGNDESNGGRLRSLAVPGILAAASAGLGLLLTSRPRRLQEAVKKLSGRTRDVVENRHDLMSDLKEHAESVAARVPSGSGGEAKELEDRRRERKERRERRRQKART
jgi:hypothetical protein